MSTADGRHADLLLAVDGGNSKTDVRLVRADGTQVRQAIGGPFRPQVAGVPAAMAVLDALVGEVLVGEVLEAEGVGGTTSGVGTTSTASTTSTATAPAAPRVRGIAAFLAGADLPEEITTLQAEVEARGWAQEVYVANDTFAVLYAGSPQREGVAVVCGTGINCVAVAPDGRTATFPGLGWESGDWGGGGDLGRAALFWAVRAEDGRGPATTLLDAVTTHFDRPRALDVVLAIHRGQESDRRLAQLAPAVFAAADAGDEIAGWLIDLLADEIAGMATSAARTLGLEAPPVLLGGSVAAAGHPRLLDRVRDRAPGPITVVTDAPVVGAVRYAVGRWGADAPVSV
ncbi:ATPase BadF/BadG/BcrA/BcrD type [Catenulispora acidiphila DSM 44928]|uniref:ATPase BadF/BadG/BcrA/BcrD type n=1 Tax=Catenulispora acidiphila (strain DSM 44928 / JCM 14897 / NBRC 102108 / NRRL B-24433 / ID139908) TaxID=479433 RepID=C7PW96_CATAD|nr:BadF/BadG/BcrA/BcrD ATPase family protein [Catenulispora acidiphila]ACU73344.1 ATPase BadF/BadG/BcrA/BcrD type [Catenulispora acidiphila DSM 44928]